ncbi:MAG: hypothetical protein AB7O04_03570 [Hyphomonadaceae bacterium]
MQGTQTHKTQQRSAGGKWLGRVFWPASVWMSFAHFNEHPADDYVERTAPIVAMAIAFWILVGALAAIWFSNGSARMFQVMLFFLPVLYLIGFGTYLSREERFAGEDKS